ncbi:MAG: hypothetical protein AB1779_04475, partial [Candidatus Thermoplasmatota archaeon]
GFWGCSGDCGWNDATEYSHRTDPNNADTDGGGRNDDVDSSPLYRPLGGDGDSPQAGDCWDS